MSLENEMQNLYKVGAIRYGRPHYISSRGRSMATSIATTATILLSKCFLGFVGNVILNISQEAIFKNMNFG